MAFDFQENFLNFWDILQSEIIGGAILMYIVIMFLTILFSLRSNMHPKTTIVLLFVWTFFFVAATGHVLLYTVSLLGVGILYYFVIAKKARRGF